MLRARTRSPALNVAGTSALMRKRSPGDSSAARTRSAVSSGTSGLPLRADARLELLARDEPVLDGELLEPEEPVLVVAGRQVLGGGHLLAGIAAHVDGPLAPRPHRHVQGEDPALPVVMKDGLVLFPIDRAEPVHAAEVVGAVHRPGALGSPTPIMESRVTSPASSASLMASVPAGRRGRTR